MGSERLIVAGLEVERLGWGPVVVFVHGSVVDAARTWRCQLALAERWTLLLANRPGFGESRALARGDFELEAPLFAELLGAGAHLVGHSYGAVIALLAAAARPGAVRSLVVSEPGLLRLAAGERLGDELIASGERLYASASAMTAGEFLRLFRAGVHSAHETPEELPAWLERGARHAARERPAWHAEVPLGELAAASFPKLVISGGHSPVFEIVCDRLAERINAERKIVAGRGHTIPTVGDQYNSLVEGFLSAAESSAPH